MSADTIQIGQWGEGIAAEYLEKNGYSILTRNFHTPTGEIDIVAFNPDTRLSCLVFVEVKTRTSQKHGYPEEGVSKKKWDHLQTAIQCYLESHPDMHVEWRVDVIAIVGHPDQENPQIQHFENVVMADERY
jgi:putative endonuclease